MEEIYGNFEDLILIYLHHHQKVSETHLADLNAFFTASHCLLQPLVLALEELGVKVGYSSGQYFEHVSVLAFDWVEELLHLLIVIWEGNEPVEFLGDPLQHEDVLAFLILLVAVDRQRCDFN